MPPGSTRDRLLDAAARIIREQGITGATIREIALQAGVAEAVQHHSASKNELITATHVERLTALRLSAAVHRLAARVGQGSVAANLEALAADAIEAYAELFPFAAGFAADGEAAAPLRAEPTRSRPSGPFRAHEAVAAACLRIEEEQGRVELIMPAPLTSAALLGACHAGTVPPAVQPRGPVGTEVPQFARQTASAPWSGSASPARPRPPPSGGPRGGRVPLRPSEFPGSSPD